MPDPCSSDRGSAELLVREINRSLLLPLVRAHREINWSWCSRVVHPIEDDVADTKRSVDSLLVLAREGGATAERFAKFAQENLCQESWDFILDGVQYEMVSVFLGFCPCRRNTCRPGAMRLVVRPWAGFALLGSEQLPERTYGLGKISICGFSVRGEG